MPSGAPAWSHSSCAACSPAARLDHDLQQNRQRYELPGFLQRAIELGQRIAVHPLHHQVKVPILLAEVERLRDIDVLDARGNPSLVQEHPPKAPVLRQVGQDGLQCDQLLEAVLALQPGQPDAGHAALGDGTEELVAVELVPRRKLWELRSR
jgi:hypothetical protein